MIKPKCIPKKEVARILNISESSVSRWTREKPDFPKPFKLGSNKTHWDVDEINEWYDKIKEVRGFLGKRPQRVLNVIKTQ